MEISKELKQVILSTLNLTDFAIEKETYAYQVPGWDSLSHISIILNIEKIFKVKFNSREVAGLKNIGDLHDLVEQKTKENFKSLKSA